MNIANEKRTTNTKQETGQLLCRIVILNYNGAELLPQCLPSIVRASEGAAHPTRVTILDNHSTDDGLLYVRRHFPNVAIVTPPANRFLCSFNDYLPTIDEPVVILLNNDLRVGENFVDPLMQKFESEPNIFLVAPRVMNYEGTKVQAARSKMGFRFGQFWCDARYPGYEHEVMTPSETASSGFGAFSREKFLELGGYDDRYLPGILEDVDLCYRAARSGYRLYYEPESVVYHMGQASFKKAFGEKKIASLAYRNTFLFMWKNFSGVQFWCTHLLFLPLRLLLSLVRGNLAMNQGFFQAFMLQLRGSR